VTAAELVAKAAFKDGKFSQAFPYFGVERRGAPVQSFVRISDSFIRRRSQIYNPDFVIVFDPTLADAVDVTAGLQENGYVIINSAKEIKTSAKTVCVDATRIALDIIGKPIVNTCMLGAFAKVSGLITLNSLKEAIDEQFPAKIAEGNKKAVEVVYEQS
jgi:pyruvate ferredoxin oxidoreductase gamma subunit